MIMLAALVLLTVFASRGFCGWVCPFGSLQEWLGLLGRKIFRRRFNPTGRLDRSLRSLKYAILVAVVALTWHTGTLVFRDYDPFLAFFHLGRGVSELPWAYAALGVVLIGSLWIERFFCKYACPLGALLGILGRFGLAKIRRDAADCKGCNICQKKCPAHVDFLSVTTIRNAECNHCMDCVVHCPKPNVLSLQGARWHFSHAAYGAVLVAGLFAFIGVSQLAGRWQTRPPAVSFTNADGKLDPDNIRGWMTLGEISAGYSMPLEALYRAAGIPAHVPPTARLNTIALEYAANNFEPDRVREIVRAHLTGKPAKRPAASNTEVRGSMTLNEIALKTGVSKGRILKTLGLPSDIDGRVPVREWVHERGESIQDLRDAVESYR
jgi:polyferredoxin